MFVCVFICVCLNSVVCRAELSDPVPALSTALQQRLDDQFEVHLKREYGPEYDSEFEEGSDLDPEAEEEGMSIVCSFLCTVQRMHLATPLVVVWEEGGNCLLQKLRDFKICVGLRSISYSNSEYLDVRLLHIPCVFF